MSAQLYTGHTGHVRLGDIEHRFNYPVLFMGLDPDRMPESEQGRWFGHNRKALLSMHDVDYLGKDSGSVRHKLHPHLERAGVTESPHRVVLITTPRLLGYVFNPVSFHYLFNADNDCFAVVAEVSNTFGEKHLYVLHEKLSPEPGFDLHFRCPKAFHVSPFYDREGEYDFLLTLPGKHLHIRIDKLRDGTPEFSAWLKGTARPMTRNTILRSLLKQPFTIALTTPRIIAQAAVLKFRRKLPVYTKPIPDSDMTIQTPPPTRFQRTAARLFIRRLNDVELGGLVVTLPSGTTHKAGPLNATAPQHIHIRSWKFFNRVMRRGDIGFAEAYMEGDFDTPDLAGLLTLLGRNQQRLRQRGLRQRGIAAWLLAQAHRRRKNHKSNSRRNIAAHYDLSNTFFSRWLDETMTYSSAVFERPDEPLAAAQRRKYALLIDKARIQSEHHVLEIGCGWGGFAIEAVKRTGCRVTGITLSKEQKLFADARIREEGLEDRITIRLIDYRDMEGTFDRVVSIEMLEAVGHEYFDSYFETIDRLLKPDGMASLQVITIPDQRYDAYRRGCDFIQEYIFPGGHLPCMSALSASMRRSCTDLTIEQVENYPEHYAETLRRWRVGFEKTWPETVKQEGFDEHFRRMWRYYLAYCEAGFKTRQIHLLHLTLARSASLGSAPLPKAETSSSESVGASRQLGGDPLPPQ